ncbi:MAG: Fe-S protein assembly co-chaperone HscB [Pseudohongiellaceae bacterium]
MSEDISSQNYFEIFSLPETFQIDAEKLRQEYRRLQAEFHPDKFAAASDRDRRLALQYTSILNDAYETLRSPLRRSGYLLTLHGIDPEENNQAHLGPGFLMAQMKLRERLETIAVQEELEELDRLKSDVANEINCYQDEISRLFQDQGYTSAKPVYNKLQFLYKLESEINQIEEKLLDY